MEKQTESLKVFVRAPKLALKVLFKLKLRKLFDKFSMFKLGYIKNNNIPALVNEEINVNEIVKY